MEFFALLKSALAAVAALPAILDRIESGIKAIKLEALENAHQQAVQELQDAVKLIKEAKNGDITKIDAALDALTKRK
jgi:hypothetical protein